MATGYAREKLMKAVYGMASSPLSIQQRVANAFTFHLIHLNVDVDLPDELRSRFSHLVEMVTAREALGDVGSIHATTARMSEEEATEIADGIGSLFDSVSARHRRDAD